MSSMSMSMSMMMILGATLFFTHRCYRRGTRRSSATLHLLMHLLARATSRQVDRMRQHLCNRLKVLLDGLGASRKSQHQSLATDARDGPAQRSKRRDLDRFRKDQMGDAWGLTFEEREDGLDGNHAMFFFVFPIEARKTKALVIVFFYSPLFTSGSRNVRGAG